MAETQNKEFVYFGPRKIAVWPDELKLFPVEPASDNITIIPNPDIYEIQGRLVEAILECARLTGASAAGESPAGRRRQATTSTPSHGPSFARMEVKR